MTYVIPAQHEAAVPPVVTTMTPVSPMPNPGAPLVMNHQDHHHQAMKQPLMSYNSHSALPRRESDNSSEVSPLECGSIKPNPYYNPQLDPARLPFIPPVEIFVRVRHETPDWLQLPEKLEDQNNNVVDMIPELAPTSTEETDDKTPPKTESGGVFSRRRSLVMSPRSPKSPVPPRTSLIKKKNSSHHLRRHSCTVEFDPTAENVEKEEDGPEILNLSPMTPSRQCKIRTHRKTRSATAMGSFWGKHLSSMLSPNPTLTTEGCCTDSQIYDAPTMNAISPSSSLLQLAPIPAESPLMLPTFSNHSHHNHGPNPNKGEKIELHPAHGFLT